MGTIDCIDIGRATSDSRSPYRMALYLKKEFKTTIYRCKTIVTD